MAEVFELARKRITADEVGNRYVGVENLAQNCEGLASTGSFATSGAIGFEVGDVLVGNIRPYLRKVWQASFSGGTNGDVLTFRIRPQFNEIISPRFAYQWIASDFFWDVAIQTSRGGKMPRGDKKAIMNSKFPLIKEQAQLEIADKLEPFSTLLSGLSDGLPSEIAARRRQYEYYRDKLFTFTEIVA